MWKYRIDGQEHGPIDTKQLQDLAKTGQLRPADLIWREGLKEWVPASKAKGLFPPIQNDHVTPDSPPVEHQSEGDSSSIDDSDEPIPSVASDQTMSKKIANSWQELTGVRKICFILFCLAMLGYFLDISGCNSDSRAITSAQQAIGKRFGLSVWEANNRDFKVLERNDDKDLYLVHGKVDKKNAFGGHVATYYILVVKLYDDDTFSVLPMGIIECGSSPSSHQIETAKTLGGWVNKSTDNE